MTSNRHFDRVAVLGAHESNAPWAFELKVKRAIQTVWQPRALYMLDHRKLSSEVLAGMLAVIEPDLVLCFRCENVDWVRITQPELYKRPPLWVQWLTETVVGDGPIADTNRANLRRSLGWMGHVFYHEPETREVISTMAQVVAVEPPPMDLLPCVAVDPEVNKRLRSVDISKWFFEDEPWKNPANTSTEPPVKDIDILWYGSTTPRRDRILASLHQAGLEVTSTGATGESLNEQINRSRLVLNIHLGASLNAETRIAEVLGAGTCLLTEPLHPEITKYLGIEPGVHYLEFDVAEGSPVVVRDRLRGALGDWQWRERIAAAGYQAMRHHTLERRVADMRTTLTLSHRWDEESASWHRV